MHSTTPLSAHSSNATPKSRTTVLNEVAAAHSLDGTTSKSKPKAPKTTRTSKKPKIVEDDELEIQVAPAIGSLGDEDDTRERVAALSSPMKGKDARQVTAVSIAYHFQSFSDRCCRLKSRLNMEKKTYFSDFLPLRRRRSRTILHLTLCKNTLPKLIVSLP